MSIRQAGTWAVMVTVIAAMVWLTASIVEAHSLGYSSVDGCEIRWEESTKYDTERAAAQDAWEAIKGNDNCVDLEPDTWYTVADLELMDVNFPMESWLGRWRARLGTAQADPIQFNVPKMDPSDSCKRNGVAIHELGIL